jgi:hypothetical protein
VGNRSGEHVPALDGDGSLVDLVEDDLAREALQLDREVRRSHEAADGGLQVLPDLLRGVEVEV